MQLRAEHPAGVNAEFNWYRLNLADTTLDLYHQDTNVPFSLITGLQEGGYQLVVRNLADLSAPVDTFTTWLFRDTFRIDEVRYEIDCDALQLNMLTTPSIYASYTIYNFNDFLHPPHAGETIFSRAHTVRWTPVDANGNETEIFPGVDNPDQTWRTRINTRTYIDAPPPLAAAAYKLEVEDVFYKKAVYTTPYTINAIAVYANPVVEALDKEGHWKDAGEEPEGEALYRTRFDHSRSVNAGRYQWKGFANKEQPNGDKTLVWTDSTTHSNDYIYPRMPYKGQVYDGYTPGAYQVRLIVRNAVCVDSASIRYITVVPSSFDAGAIPNVFTPNGDNQNDIFTFVKGKEPISLEYIKVYIYNRSGGLVYSYEGRSDEWQGWDGRMTGSRGDAADGVYYYVISGQGWDDKDYSSKEYTGYLHLFR